MFRSVLIIWTMLACLFLFGSGLYALLAPGGQTGLAIMLIVFGVLLAYVTGLEEWGWRRRPRSAARASATRPPTRRSGASPKDTRRRKQAAVGVAAG